MWILKWYHFVPPLFFLIYNIKASSANNPLINSKVGLIRGLRDKDGNYSMFLGIPYATVNKSNPFGLSSPYPKFTEVFEAYDDSAMCPQFEEFNHTIVGTIDCLHIHIYVPNSSNSKLPVLVYFYGGKFMTGFAGRYIFGPTYLIEKGVILITFNYRVSAYGFMCLDTPDVPGNQGLKDQQLALKWIKDNIEAFGGDPDKITLCGSSSGASTIDFHLIYSNRNLFNRVILQSGSALHPWAAMEPDTSAPLKLSRHLGSTATNVNEALAFLSKLDSNLVIAATTELDLLFGVCVEKDYRNVEKFIYEYPHNIIKPNLENVTMVFLSSSDEALASYDNKPLKDFTTSNLFLDSIERYFNFDAVKLLEMEKYITKFYIGDDKIGSRVKQGIIELNSDFYFNSPLVRTIDKYLNSGAKIYYCVFAYTGNRNFLQDRFNVTTKGTSHADETGYLFDISYYMDKNQTLEDKLMIDRITTLWTNFVKFGNPTPQTTELLPVQWPTVTKDSQYYLIIGSELKVKKRFLNSRMVFWDLFYKINEKAQIGYRENVDQFSCVAIYDRYNFLNGY